MHGIFGTQIDLGDSIIMMSVRALDYDTFGFDVELCKFLLGWVVIVVIVVVVTGIDAYLHLCI